MTTATVKILRSGLEIKEIPISATGNISDALDILGRAGWEGTLTPSDSMAMLLLKESLCPGATYHLHLQEQPGKWKFGDESEDDRSASHKRQREDESASRHPEEVVEWLCGKFGAQLKEAHEHAAPGAEREFSTEFPADISCKGASSLPKYMSMEGRQVTTDNFVYWLANIFKRFRNREAGTDSLEFRRGVVQMLLLSSPGAGKTSFLAMVLRLLRRWLDQKEDECVARLVNAMYQSGPHSAVRVNLAKELLSALRALAGTQQGQPWHLFLSLRCQEMETAKPERRLHLPTQQATALRLLYGAITPVDPNMPGDSYETFLYEIPSGLREQITIRSVLECMRRVFGVRGAMIVVALLDEGNVASGTFELKQDKVEVTWLQEFLSKIILAMNQRIKDQHENLLVPLTATTRWRSNILNNRVWTLSGTSKAVQIPLPSLTKQQREKVLLDLARRVAKAAGRDLPEEVSHPAKVAADYVGGVPRLLSELAIEIGRENWHESFDLHLAGLQPRDIPVLLNGVMKRAYQEQQIEKLFNVDNLDTKKDCLRKLVAWIMLDASVTRAQRVLENHTESPTVGELENEGWILAEVHGWDALRGAEGGQAEGELEDADAHHRLPSPLPSVAPRQLELPSMSVKQGSGEMEPMHTQSLQPERERALADRQAQADASFAPQQVVGDLPCSGSASAQPPQPLAAASQSSVSHLQPPQQGESSAAAGNITPLGAHQQPPSVSSPALHSCGTPQLRVVMDGTPHTVQRSSEVYEVTATSSSLGGLGSPGESGLVQDGTGTGKPSRSPGLDPVHISMSPLALEELMRQLGMLNDADLSVFSNLVVRESPLDKEIVDAMAIAIKLEAFAILGRHCVSFQDLFPALRTPEDLQGVQFIVPAGHLHLGERQTSQMSAEQTKAEIERIGTGIWQTWEGSEEQWAPEGIQIGLLGVGNRERDSLVVLVDTQGRLWAVVIQSKQTSNEKYITAKSVLHNLQTDVRDTFALPELPPEWLQWHLPGTKKQPNVRPVPATACSSEQSEDIGADEKLSISMRPDGQKKLRLSSAKLIYFFVSDGQISKDQDEVFRELRQKKHPWLRKVVLVSYRQAICWYGRLGALRRATFRKAVCGRLAKA